jgi:hypothetical protein
METSMRHAILALALLASGAAASAQAQPATTSVSAVTVSAQGPKAPTPSQVAEHRRQLLLPTVDQEVALLCPRDNCDAPSLYRWVRSQAKPVAQLSATPAQGAATRTGM